MVTDQLVLRSMVGDVAVLALNRPHRHNAFDDALLEEFDAAVTWAAGDDAVRSVVLRGEGQSFSAGRDTSQLGVRPLGVTDESFVLACQSTRRNLLACPKPVVAALKGAVFGGGLETALAADMRMAGASTRLKLPQVGFGVMTSWGGSILTTILAGPARAKYLVMSGEEISAHQAMAWGLVEWVVPDDEVDSQALAMATRLAGNPRLATSLAKRVIDEIWSGVIDQGFKREFAAQSELMASDEYRARRDALHNGR